MRLGEFLMLQEKFENILLSVQNWGNVRKSNQDEIDTIQFLPFSIMCVKESKG